MKSYKPPITCWRAFVDCEQIGYRFETKEDAKEAIQKYIADHRDSSQLEPVVVVRPSYAPLDKARFETEKVALAAS